MNSICQKIQSAFSLLEVLIGVFIMALAIIPISALITGDSKNTVVLANAETAQGYARNILDTILEHVDFDEILAGAPGIIKGKSAELYGKKLFPNAETLSIGQACEGYIINKGYKFKLYLEIREFKENDLLFSTFKTPDLLSIFTTASSSKNLSEIAVEEEKNGNPSYLSGNKGIYNNNSWASEIDNYKPVHFSKDSTNVTSLLKALLLRIEWSNEDKNLSDNNSKRQFFWLVTHKARL